MSEMKEERADSIRLPFQEGGIGWMQALQETHDMAKQN